MSINFDWQQFQSSPIRLYLTREFVDRCLALCFNTRSLLAECSSEAFGCISPESNIATVSRLSEMNLCSDKGAGNTDATKHYSSSLEDPRLRRQFNEFWATAKKGDFMLDVHTHMAGCRMRDAQSYDDYWKLSAADVSGFIGCTKILESKGVLFFGAMVYVDEHGNCGLVVTHFDTRAKRIMKVDKLYLISDKQIPTLLTGQKGVNIGNCNDIIH